MSADPASVNTAAFAFVQELARELNRGDLNLPSFPDSVVRIRKALDDPNCSPDKLARIATADQVLAGRLLKMANSALLQRGGGAVSELRTAIFKLGFAMVRNAAISVAMQQMFQTKDLGGLAPKIRELWEESTKVAAVCYVIAKSLTRHNPDEAFLAGMLHNVGKVYIYTRAKTIAEIAKDPQLLSHVQDAWHGPIGKSIIEFPAGKLDPGESTFTCARRELEEETGYTASEWAYACEIHNAAAYSTESIWIYFARGLVAGPQRRPALAPQRRRLYHRGPAIVSS